MQATLRDPHRMMTVGVNLRQQVVTSPEERRSRFGRLAREHEAGMLRFATSMAAGNADVAADWVQDALIQGYRSYLKLDPEPLEFFRAWMYQIIRHVAYRASGKDQRTQNVEDIDAVADSNAVAASPFDELVGNEIDVRIRRALQALPETQRMCVVLVDMEQLDYEETSRVMGIPTGTVRSRLSRGRMKLQELLGPNFSPHQEDHS